MSAKDNDSPSATSKSSWVMLPAELPRDRPQYISVETPSKTRCVEWVQLAVNVALAIAAFCAIGIYRGQLRAMKDQLGEMAKQYPELQKSANAALNASTTAQNQLIDFENSERAILTVTQVFDPSYSHVTFVVKNIGPTAALDINVDQSQQGGTAPSTQKTYTYWPPEKELESHIRPIAPNKGGIALASGEKREMPGGVTLGHINSGDWFFIYINLGYKDIFGKAKHIYSCAYYVETHHAYKFEQCKPLAHYENQKQ